MVNCAQQERRTLKTGLPPGYFGSILDCLAALFSCRPPLLVYSLRVSLSLALEIKLGCFLRAGGRPFDGAPPAADEEDFVDEDVPCDEAWVVVFLCGA